MAQYITTRPISAELADAAASRIPAFCRSVDLYERDSGMAVFRVHVNEVRHVRKAIRSARLALSVDWGRLTRPASATVASGGGK